MRRIIVTALLLSLAVVWCIESSAGQEAAKTQAETAKLAIIPLITLQPGQTRELMLSTWCTVGLTRSSGFGLTEMRDGKPVVSGVAGKSFSRDGITISVPGPEKATAFANSARFAALKKQSIDAFVVTITASADAKPGLIELHLVDSTCSGHCHSHFRVFVEEK